MEFREGRMSSCYRSYKRVKIIQRPRIHLWALKQMAKEKQGRGELGAWRKEQALHTMGGEELCPFGMVGTC